MLGIDGLSLGSTSPLSSCRSSPARQTEGCGSRNHWDLVCALQDMIHRGAGLPHSWGSGFSPDDNAIPPHPSQQLRTSALLVRGCWDCHDFLLQAFLVPPSWVISTVLGSSWNNSVAPSHQCLLTHFISSCEKSWCCYLCFTEPPKVHCFWGLCYGITTAHG